MDADPTTAENAVANRADDSHAGNIVVFRIESEFWLDEKRSGARVDQRAPLPGVAA